MHEALQEEALAQKLGTIDWLAHTSIRTLREAIIQRIKGHISEIGYEPRECAPEDAFHFCKSKSFIFPTGIVARDVPDFVAKLPSITDRSIYFHFYEARLRLGRPTNDFSYWLLGRGEEDLAIAIDSLNSYGMSIDELRAAILRVCSDHERGRNARQLE